MNDGDTWCLVINIPTIFSFYLCPKQGLSTREKVNNKWKWNSKPKRLMKYFNQV